MTSMIATTRSPLQALTSSAASQFVAFIYKGRGASRSPYEDKDSGSLISLSMVAERISMSQGDESASYVVPDDATIDILLAI
jgi:hypothetical protein